MRFNIRSILSLLGLLVMLNGGFMLLCIPVSLYFKESQWLDLCIAGALSIVIGSLSFFLLKPKIKAGINKRDGFIIVTLGWIMLSLSGTLPFLISGEIPRFADAFFETMSGYTTTGASILNDIESMSHSLLLWRSLTHWIGGMGIIVLAVAILPLLGIGGMQLFVAEAPGLTPDKLKPRITDTAKRLWLIYFGLTALQTLLLYLGGMSLFDSVNHSMATMATGGFSTKQDSIAYYTSPYIHYIITIFMFLAGTNFTLLYFGLHNRLKSIWKNDEFKFYLIFTLLFALFISVIVYSVTGNSFEQSFRESIFQLVSVVTTTGFITADFTAWTPMLTVLFFMLMFVGGSAGSTAGGIKVVRHVILIKNSIMELRRQLHPNAVLPVRLNKKAISSDITFNVMAFTITYFMIFAIGSIVISGLGYDFETTIGAVASCLGNIGPGLSKVGPIYNYAFFSDGAKWFLSFMMLLGRLELFTVLILFTPYFWAKH